MPIDVYSTIRRRAMMFDFRPGQLVNESELAREMGVSRTPLRAALARLESEGYLERTDGRGFRCRNLEARPIFNLYETRCAIETFAVSRACERATDDQIEELRQFCQREGQQRLELSEEAQLDHDEKFHVRLVGLSGNPKIADELQRLNGKIRFARWVDMPGRIEASGSEHIAIVDAVRQRDAEKARRLLDEHISRRQDQIQNVIKQGFARICMDQSAWSD